MFEIKGSSIEGQGVFASEAIKKNCVIGPAYTLIGEVNNQYIAGDITIIVKHLLQGLNNIIILYSLKL